jgi:hypothetical protein
MCVVLSCVGRGLRAGLIPRPRNPTKCLKGSIRNKKNPTPEKGIKKMTKKKKKMFGSTKEGKPVRYFRISSEIFQYLSVNKHQHRHIFRQLQCWIQRFGYNCSLSKADVRSLILLSLWKWRSNPLLEHMRNFISLLVRAQIGRLAARSPHLTRRDNRLWCLRVMWKLSQSLHREPVHVASRRNPCCVWRTNRNLDLCSTSNNLKRKNGRAV